jgi:hypothetical protein
MLAPSLYFEEIGQVPGGCVLQEPVDRHAARRIEPSGILRVLQDRVLARI